MLNKQSHMPLYVQLKDELAGRIKHGAMKVGSQIQTESELMKQYGVGRATVREAVALLVSEGYLVKRQGIGTFVCNLQPSMGFEPLISLTASLRARGVNPRNVVTISERFVPGAELLAQLRWSTPETCTHVRRIRYAESAPIAVEDSWFSHEFQDVGEKYDLTGSLSRIIIEDLKVDIARIDQVIVPRLPSSEEKSLLEFQGDARVLQMDRWIYIVGRETPFYTLRFIVPTDIYYSLGL
ncbi:MAG TPA: GntR family transcriptional regulator [Clostridia bacterium]|nr:GntR family transcriptional regulator [Clostridia bacterium]